MTPPPVSARMNLKWKRNTTRNKRKTISDMQCSRRNASKVQWAPTIRGYSRHEDKHFVEHTNRSPEGHQQIQFYYYLKCESLDPSRTGQLISESMNLCKSKPLNSPTIDNRSLYICQSIPGHAVKSWNWGAFPSNIHSYQAINCVTQSHWSICSER